MSHYTLSVVSAVVLMLAAVPHLVHAWREEPDEDGPLGWWLPDIGCSTAAATETRVRETSALVQMQAYLSARREADEVPDVAPVRVTGRPMPMMHTADGVEAVVPHERVCRCVPCPGRGNDGHGMSHCAECCYGSGVEVEPGCPTHDPLSATLGEADWLDHDHIQTWIARHRAGFPLAG